MITDAKPLLWATGLFLTLGVGAGAVATVLEDQLTIQAFGAFLAGAGLLWVNLAIGAALVESVTRVMASGGNPALGTLALMAKTGFLFASFLALGSTLGMVAVVAGAIATLGSFGLAVVTVPLFAPTLMETA